MIMKYEVGDLVEYKKKLYLVTEVQENHIDIEDEKSTYMYRLHGVNRWILDCFIGEPE